jgi:hypothetical protein
VATRNWRVVGVGRSIIHILGAACTRGCRRRGMVRTVDRVAPGLEIATIARTTGLLGDEKGYVVASVRGGVEASGAHHTAVVEGTVSVTGC